MKVVVPEFHLNIKDKTEEPLEGHHVSHCFGVSLHLDYPGHIKNLENLQIRLHNMMGTTSSLPLSTALYKDPMWLHQVEWG